MLPISEGECGCDPIELALAMLLLVISELDSSGESLPDPTLFSTNLMEI
jgi:hypothetical protein